jgi:hypothetical protein
MPDKVYTRPLLDKLGVEPEARVAFVNLEEPWFEALLAERGVSVERPVPGADLQLIFVGAEVPGDLDVLPALRKAIRPNGAIWVISRKGRAATLRDVDVIEGALAAGLVDNKVVSFSETQTSARLVIRLRDRPAATAGG